MNDLVSSSTTTSPRMLAHPIRHRFSRSPSLLKAPPPLPGFRRLVICSAEPYLITNLESAEKTRKELSVKLADPDVVSNPSEYQKLAQSLSELDDVVATFGRFKDCEKKLLDTKALAKDDEMDEDMVAMVTLEIDSLNCQIRELEEQLKTQVMMQTIKQQWPIHSTPVTKQPTTTASATPNSGVVFRRKLLYLKRHLNVDPLKAMTLNPDFRSAPISAVKAVELCLSSMGLSRTDLGRILDMHPQLLTADPDRHLYPILDFLLHEALIPFPDIRRALVRCPRLLLCDIGTQLRPNLEFLARIGFTGRSNAIDSRTVTLLVSSVEHTLHPKLAYLERELGLSAEEVAVMAVRSPGILTLSLEKNLVPKVDYFLREMRGDVVELKRFPQYFSFSLERRIRPRHLAMKAAGFTVPLAELLKVSDGEFSARLIEMRLRTISKVEHGRLVL